jgi:hypothetical protein
VEAIESKVSMVATPEKSVGKAIDTAVYSAIEKIAIPIWFTNNLTTS